MTGPLRRCFSEKGVFIGHQVAERSGPQTPAAALGLGRDQTHAAGIVDHRLDLPRALAGGNARGIADLHLVANSTLSGKAQQVGKQDALGQKILGKVQTQRLTSYVGGPCHHLSPVETLLQRGDLDQRRDLFERAIS
jgi:hypothetical protein